MPEALVDQLLRNVYKVLLTRGMVGTIVYSVDQETQALLSLLIGESSVTRTASG